MQEVFQHLQVLCPPVLIDLQKMDSGHKIHANRLSHIIGHCRKALKKYECASGDIFKQSLQEVIDNKNMYSYRIKDLLSHEEDEIYFQKHAKKDYTAAVQVFGGEVMATAQRLSVKIETKAGVMSLHQYIQYIGYVYNLINARGNVQKEAAVKQWKKLAEVFEYMMDKKYFEQYAATDYHAAMIVFEGPIASTSLKLTRKFHVQTGEELSMYQYFHRLSLAYEIEKTQTKHGKQLQIGVIIKLWKKLSGV
ncbi:hypothetical protein COB57_01035 [Candidatus Peregrinibacteria bacterium]|nr:MAG: hypothetical protein COB57_01035 [Candidatus Peregrinibacteria bacterium]